MTESCLICRIAAGQDKAYRILEDDKILAFLDKFPSSSGHTLVVLKKHGLGIGDYTGEELGILFAGVKTVTAALEKAFHTEGLTIGINHKEQAGLPHLHVHLIPRFPGDGGKIIQSLVYNKTSEDLKSIQEKIRGCL